MKRTLLYLLIFLLISCGERTKPISNNEQEQYVSDTNYSTDIPFEIGNDTIALQLDRDRVRSLAITTHQIARVIRDTLLQGSTNTDLNVLLDTKIIFRNGRGELILIPIRSVLKPVE